MLTISMIVAIGIVRIVDTFKAQYKGTCHDRPKLVYTFPHLPFLHVYGALYIVSYICNSVCKKTRNFGKKTIQNYLGINRPGSIN